MGKRDNITVLREQGKERTFYHLDLRDTEIFKSPAYYLQQSDVVYVYPSKVRAGQSRINENNFRSFNFWVSLPSMVLSMTTLGPPRTIQTRSSFRYAIYGPCSGGINGGTCCR